MNLPLCNPEAVARLKRLAAATPGASTRAMFGQTACFVAGLMVGGTWGSTLMLRLSPADRLAADSAGFAVFDPRGGRPMSDYRVVPVDLPETEVAAWFARAMAYTLTLPPKTTRSARPAKAR